MKRILSVSLCIAALLACGDIQSQKELIETTPRGYRYSILEDAPGDVAEVGNFVLVHTVMAHQDSVISDTRTNPGKPTVVKIEDEVARKKSAAGPVEDLLVKLSVGDSARFYYPLDSFKVKPDRLKNFREVTYDLKVVDIFKTEAELNNYFAAEQLKAQEEEEAFQKKADEMGEMVAGLYSAYKDNTSKTAWITTESGLKYTLVKKSGTGVKAKPGDYVRTNYYGIFEADGTMFDNSYKRGETFDFTVSQDPVIKGWDEAVQILDKGDQALIVVPSELAWGSQGFPGLIAPDTDVIFYLEVVGIGEME